MLLTEQNILLLNYSYFFEQLTVKIILRKQISYNVIREFIEILSEVAQPKSLLAKKTKILVIQNATNNCKKYKIPRDKRETTTFFGSQNFIQNAECCFPEIFLRETSILLFFKR